MPNFLEKLLNDYDTLHAKLYKILAIMSSIHIGVYENHLAISMLFLKPSKHLVDSIFTAFGSTIVQHNLETKIVSFCQPKGLDSTECCQNPIGISE